MKSLPVIAIVLGILLLVGSVTWALLFPASRSWTTDKNERMSELSIKGHQLGGELDAAQRRPSMHGRSVAEIEAEYKQVTDELAQLRGEFESKRDRPKTMAAILRWTGAACVAVGAFIMFASRGG
jgi:hypothetical protein